MPGEFQPVYSPRFTVTVGNNTYRESGGRIADLVVETTIDGADRVSFTLNYPFDPEFGDFSDLTWSDFEPGTPVDVATGWGGDGELAPLFLGTVQSVVADFAPGKGPLVKVSGYGKLHEMMGGTTSRSWSDSSIGDVVEEVLSSYFGDREVDGADLTLDKIIQHNESDYRFVRGLAAKYGYHFYAQRDTIYFTPRTAVGGGEPVLTLRYGEALDSFSAEINRSRDVRTVEVRYWDMENETEVIGSATADVNNEKTEVFRIPCRSSEEADRIASNKLQGLSSSVAEGYGEVDGMPSITAGATIKLTALGERFSADYYVTKATHRMGGSGYRTTFEATEVPQ